jgi:hypothetical protein
MNKLFPPSLPEWHASVVGFGSGFAFGAARCDSGVARAFVRAVLVLEDDAGHVAQAEDEAAYATACFVVGAVVGRAFDRREKR